MGDRRIVVLGGSADIYDRARQLAIEVLPVHKPGTATPDLLHGFERAIIADYETDPHLTDLLRQLHRTLPFRAVIGPGESGLLPAARLSAALELPGTPVHVVEAIRDKHAMRKRLEGTQFGQVAATLASTADEVRSFAERVGYPVIMKPADGLGSRDVRRISGPEDIDDLPLKPATFLIEEFIDGREFSIESFSFDGVHRILGINEETKIGAAPNPFVEIAHEMPAQLDRSTREELVIFVTEFLDAIGLSDGPAHTEVKLGSTGFRVIETHNRVGGDGLWKMVRLTTGVDLLTLALQWQLREVAPLEFTPEPVCGAAVRYFTPPPGLVTRVHGAARWAGEPNIVRIDLALKPGDRVSPVRDWKDRSGHVMAVGPTAAAAAALCQRVVDSVVIETQPL